MTNLYASCLTNLSAITALAHNLWLLPDTLSAWQATAATLSAGALLGHNLWLLPEAEDAERLRFSLNTSDLFPQSESALSPERIAELTLHSVNGASQVSRYEVSGTALLAEFEPVNRGTLLAALTLHSREITLEAEKFTHYLQEEDAQAVIAARAAAGQSNKPGRELYTKYAKALLQNGGLADETYRLICGQRFEIVPLLNPCELQVGERFTVQVLFEGKPVSGVRVSSGCEGLNGGSYAAHTRADEVGRAEVEVTRGGRWFVRAHWMQSYLGSETIDWESCWASLTFAVNAN